MQFVTAVVLAAATQAAVPVTPQQRRAQLHTVASVWKIDLSVRVQGELTCTDDKGQVNTNAVARLEFGGSAVAVTADGQLLTNRHVVDPRYVAAVTCKILAHEGCSRVVLDSLTVDYSFFDAAREEVSFTVTVSPKARDTDLCTDPMRASWAGKAEDTSRIVAMDEGADLALVKLAVADIPFVKLDTSMPQVGSPVYAIGYGESGALRRTAGPVLAACAQIEEAEVPDDVIFLPQPHVLLRVQAPLHSGMSGGPIMVGRVLIGISVLGEGECPESDPEKCEMEPESGYGIPAAYLNAWYLWATGRADTRPTVVCELPKE